MKKIFLFISFSFLMLYCSDNKTRLEKISPEEAGYSPLKLEELSSFLDTSGSSSMILLYDGKLLFEWGDVEMKHTVHSIRKSLLNSIFGIYIDRGFIDTNLTLHEIGITTDIGGDLTDSEMNARIADLLKSRSGVYMPSAAEAASMKRLRPERGSYKPGENFYYNNWDFNVLGHIFEILSGKKIYTAFYDEIAVPLGMNQFNGEYSSIEIRNDRLEIPDTDGFYQYEYQKSKYPAYHFRMSAYDLALYGQLFLNKGNWNGKQIISEDWINNSTKSYSMINNNIGIGYGMLWRILVPNEDRKTKSFFHTGTGIHMLGIYPASKLIFVHRVDTENDYDFPVSNLYKIISMVFSSKAQN